MFPSFNHSGVIPPFGTNPIDSGGSPYVTDLCSVIAKLGTSPPRRKLIKGLLDYRAALRAVGITSGFQILDGSFTEDCELLRGRAPGDIDLVTYAVLPVHPAGVVQFMTQNSVCWSTACIEAPNEWMPQSCLSISRTATGFVPLMID